jgi:hypothetical protein
MSLPYSVLGNYTASIQSGSYLDNNDTALFYTSQSNDIWFGLSSNDVIEISAYTTDDQTQEAWGILDQDKNFQTITLTYLDSLNTPTTYSYNQLVNPYTFYKNSKILVQPSSDLATIGINDGNYTIGYNFVRDMAGSLSSSLTIKDISNSRTEIKLIPSQNADVQYNSFCIKKFPIKDVAPVLLSISKNFSYDKIYKQMSLLSKYQQGISYLKFAFFLTDDGSVVLFLRNLYEDFIKYSSPLTSTINTSASTLTRIQGIKTYYNNFLLQNYEQIADFNDIRNLYISFVNTRLDEAFNQFLKSQDQNYSDMRKFCYDYFITYFYDISVSPLQQSYETKYFGQFKNVLNFGNNKYFSILDNAYLDERTSVDEPLTLLIKLSGALPYDISVKDTCWVSNFGMAPYVFTSILQNPVKYQTIKISPPNFGSPQNLINNENTNKLYSSDDLAETPDVKDNINVNKKIAELNTDYSDYSNFIVFSSAQNRLNIFKNKMIQWTILSSSLSELDRRYSASLSTNVPYPYYLKEYNNITTQTSQIINSFDGFDSYLFNGGKYQYVVTSSSFYSASYISDEDLKASQYDQNNRDSLYANVPDYIKNDSNNSDYLTFLNMAGHHFDNIYTYIAAMPIDRQIKNELTSSIPTNTLKEILYSFGWNVDDIIGSLDIDEVYLNSMDSASYNALSGEQRLQTIWNRILVNLPGLYKTKGTLECVNYLMACYGLPSSMITIREYGGTDYAENTSPTYALDEKTYMLNFSGIGDYVEGPVPYSTKTVEFKFSINTDTADEYANLTYVPLITSIPYPFTSSANFNWTVGFYKVPGNATGKIIFQMGSGSSGASLTSSILPIFNGDIFSVMLRRNNPYDLFESTNNINEIPLEYDLTVQRNEHGNRIFYSTSSMILYDDDNSIFSKWGRFRLTNGNLKGTLDKVSIWDVPIDAVDFEEHVNDLNSYGYSGSLADENLWVRLNWDYPQNMYSSSGKVWIDNQSAYYNIPDYYTNGTLTTVNPTLYSASVDIINDKWSSYYPTGSVGIVAYNFPVAIGSAFSASFIGVPTCAWVSQSVYPYHFDELTYEQNIDASKYGPNKYKNLKITRLNYTLDSRLDVYNRSTSEPDSSVSGESNQLGFFIDPQDSKNKDILRYVGKTGIMEFIGNPDNLYQDRYYDLRNKNYQYNLNGNKRTYFNELLTVYKFYFDKSIFSAIKNIIPARANAYMGVVVEPTLLERPKYQNRPLTSSAQISYKMTQNATISNIYDFNTTALWANFNTDFSLINSSNATLQTSMSNSMPPNYQTIFDLKYTGNPVREWECNFNNGYYNDMIDDVQLGFYPNFETLPRLWETSSSGPLPTGYTIPINGSVTNQPGDNGRFLIGTDTGVYNTNKFFSGSNHGNHPIIYYMLKVWDKYYYYHKTGNYAHTTNPLDNTYASASVYLYKYIVVDEYYMRNLVYFTDQIYLPVYDSSSLSYNYDFVNNSYLHAANTFLNTPDQKVNNIFATTSSLTSVLKTDFNLNLNPVAQYFELVTGYPRNHYIHKSKQFSKTKFNTSTQGIFIKGRNSVTTTVNEDGINDGSYPIESYDTSNVNIINTTNVIQNIPSSIAGTVTPTTNRLNIGNKGKNKKTSK